MASRSETSVAVIGGGIGGLTAALALLRAGFEVKVYEQASAVHEIGAGVQVTPNASRVLHGLGLAEPLARTRVKRHALDSREGGPPPGARPSRDPVAHVRCYVLIVAPMRGPAWQRGRPPARRKPAH